MMQTLFLHRKTCFVAALALSVLGGCQSKTTGMAPGVELAPDDNAKTPTDNPFVGAKYWLDPDSVPRGLAKSWRKNRSEDAALMEKLGQQPSALWVGDWVPEVEGWVKRQTRKHAKGGFLPVYVVYNIPKRDCGLYSKGGAAAGQDYKEWISKLARGIGNNKAVVILEPDALPSLDKCLDADDQKERLALIRYAVGVFASLGQTYVYLDAGHSDWIAADEMAKRLVAAGIDHATGFSLNVSNYKANEALIAFGTKVSAAAGGKPFIMDTSRNGNGPPEAVGDTEASWCNPRGRLTGSLTTADTGNPLVHAFFWIKKPGESDGACNGGPKAGQWWTEIALEKAKGLLPKP